MIFLSFDKKVDFLRFNIVHWLFLKMNTPTKYVEHSLLLPFCINLLGFFREKSAKKTKWAKNRENFYYNEQTLNMLSVLCCCIFGHLGVVGSRLKLAGIRCRSNHTGHGLMNHQTWCYATTHRCILIPWHLLVPEETTVNPCKKPVSIFMF